ncbi:MAG: MATE family efflux transporter [Spirochaetia bacterium]|nr:MATE family efflux transporter [Spirochaetia bacterium]
MREFDKGNIRNHIIHLSWPMVLANILQNIAAAYELYLLGQLGVETLAAYSIAISSITALFFSLHGALINGALAIVSRRVGEKQHHRVSEALPYMIAFGILIFLIFWLAAYFSLAPVLSFFGAKGAVLTLGMEYLSVFLFTCLIQPVYAVLLGVARGAGDSVTPLKIIGTFIAVNIILNPLFIVVFKMGIRGAALTGVISYAIGAALYVAAFMKGVNGIKLKFGPMDKKMVTTYAGLTGKSIIQNFTLDAGALVMLKLIAGFGNPFIAAYGIGARLVNFLMMVGWPICNSGGVIVGQNLGSGQKDRAMSTVIQSFILFAWVAVPAALIFLFMSNPVISAFTSDPQTIKYGSAYLIIMAPAMIFLAYGQAVQSAFNGSGAIGTATIINVSSYIIIRLILAATLPVIGALREYGMFWAISLSLAVYGIMYHLAYTHKGWLNKEI